MDIARSFFAEEDQLLFRVRLGLVDLAEESEGAKKNSVGRLITSLLLSEMQSSTVFTIIERKNLEEILKGMELALSDFVDADTAPVVGELQGVEALLMGTVNETASDYLVAVRIVDVTSGRVRATAEASLPRDLIDAEARQFIASSFQSQYGISITPFSIMGIGFPNAYKIPQYGLDLSFKLTGRLAIHLAYVWILSIELEGLDKRVVTVEENPPSATSYELTRYLRFYGDGPRLAFSGRLNPTPPAELDR